LPRKLRKEPDNRGFCAAKWNKTPQARRDHAGALRASGNGNKVAPFAVIAGEKAGIKYPPADCEPLPETVKIARRHLAQKNMRN
jgi:hypothetical protein